MKKKWLYLCVFGCVLVGIAVFLEKFDRTYTYVSGMTYFPPNATWENAPYAVGITVDGKLGKAYSDFGNKHVFVTISHNQSPILKKEYLIKAGDLDWKVNWKELSLVQIEFSDSGAGDSNKIIRTIAFKIDSLTSQASESN